MPKLRFIILLLFITGSCLFSQKEAYNWYFGENCSVTFNTPNVEPVGLMNGSMISAEGCASISDANGKLLFYTNGENVWNRNHTPMNNGDGLAGDQHSAQSAIIVPKPGNSNIYYIFTSDTGSTGNGIRYSEVDLTLGSGLGAVTAKNVFLFYPATEKMVAVRNSNGRDWWIITHEWNSDAFRTYKVTNAGVASNAIFSIAGSTHSGSSLNKSGYMKASLNGTKLALAIPNGKVELFDFNTSTGIISNAVKLSSLVLNGAYGVEFSGDGSKLYVSKSEVPSAVFQYDVTAWSPTAILNTQSLIVQNDKYSEYGALQIGPNKKIYIARLNRKFLSCISYPDSSGKPSGYIDSAIYLNERISKLGLPNFNSPYIINLSINAKSPVCLGDSIHLSSGQIFGATYDWTGPMGFKSSIASPTFEAFDELQSGYYHLTLTISGMKYSDSVFIEIIKSPKARIKLYGSNTLCEGDSVLMEAVTSDTNIRFSWSTGDTTKSIFAKAGRSYRLFVINAANCRTFTDTTINARRVSTEIYWTGPTEICIGDSIILYALPIIPGANVRWSTGESGQSIVVKESGKIILIVTTPEGCVKRDTLEVRVYDKLNVLLKPNLQNYYCDGDTVRLTTNYIGADFKYFWSNGKTTQTIEVTNSYSGWVYVYLKNGCGDTAFFNINFLPRPKVRIELDKQLPLCSGEKLTLTAITDLPNCSFKWSNGATSEKIIVDEAGRYSVTVTSDSGCPSLKYIDVDYLKKPEITITADGSPRQCEGNVIQLTVNTADTNLNYLWSTGERSKQILVNQTGNYSVIAINSFGCRDTANFSAEFFPKPEPEIESSGPLKLCRGNTLILSTKNNYRNYKWNTGEETDVIHVNLQGRYWVTVTDSNGCQGISKPVDVTISDVNITIQNLSNIKFGIQCINSSKTSSLNIINDGSETIIIDTLLHGNQSITLNPDRPLPLMLTPSSSMTLSVSFTPQKLGDYYDTLTIRTISPCYSIMKLVTTGRGIATSVFSAPDTVLPIGTHYCIPFYLDLKCGDKIFEPIIFKTKVRIDATMFYPDSNQGSWVVSKYISGNDIVFDILIANDTLLKGKEKSFEICGTVLYGDFEWTDIKIDELDWNKKEMSSISLPGELGIYSLCYFDIGHIKSLNLTKFKVNYYRISSKIEININTEESGMFEIGLYNVSGNKMSDIIDYKMDTTREDRNYQMDISSIIPGFYIIQIKTPSGILSKPLIIYK